MAGQPGSGKTWYILEEIIKQQIEKGYCQFIYDWKFPDLTTIAYNHYLKHRHKYKVPIKFNVIVFEDLTRTGRCNPLEAASMTDITDAAESARTILYGLNRSWVQRNGDFFVESPIILLTAVIWYLRKYRNGEYCTLPHVIELLQVEYSKLFTMIRCEPELEILISPFISALEAGVQLQKLLDFQPLVFSEVAGAKPVFTAQQIPPFEIPVKKEAIELSLITNGQGNASYFGNICNFSENNFVVTVKNTSGARLEDFTVSVKMHGTMFSEGLKIDRDSEMGVLNIPQMPLFPDQSRSLPFTAKVSKQNIRQVLGSSIQVTVYMNGEPVTKSYPLRSFFLLKPPAAYQPVPLTTEHFESPSYP